MTPETHTVGVLGVGRIGELLLAGLLRAGWPADRLRGTARRSERADELGSRYGVRMVDNPTAVAECDVLAVAVKPQDADALLTEIGPRVTSDTLVLSMCAGLPTGFFGSRLPAGTPVVRVMTNTPAVVDAAMTALAPGPHATADQLALTETMFAPLGHTVRVKESQLDAVTALSGSGPAYFYHLVEAMTEAGVLLGLPRQVAHELVVQTAVGSAAMLRDAGEHPVTLREAVTSPAGTTAAALRMLDRHAVRAAVVDAAEAAHDRAREIADRYAGPAA